MKIILTILLIASVTLLVIGAAIIYNGYKNNEK
jgi:multisubunit Na+/H+ antiporter MnhG subunit